MRPIAIHRRGAAEFVWLSGAFLLGTVVCCLTDAVADSGSSQAVAGAEAGIASHCLFGLAGLTGILTAWIFVRDALALMVRKRSI